jgi:hypothetical protein
MICRHGCVLAVVNGMYRSSWLPAGGVEMKFLKIQTRLYAYSFMNISMKITRERNDS